MSRFRVQPKIGHLDRLKRIYGYIRKFPDAYIRIRTGIPDLPNTTQAPQDWSHSVYGNVREQIPSDAPKPQGNPVVTLSYVDANLYHDYVNGRALTGILHFVNGTPIAWFSKRQATVETATYGSEFVAAKIATEQIIDLRNTLQYLGVPLVTMSQASLSGSTQPVPSYLFGDNRSVITSSTIPHSALNKRHIALAYHKVRESIAGRILNFIHIDGKSNPSDVLSKHCGFQQAYPILQPLLFWKGDPIKRNNDSKHNNYDHTRGAGE